MSNSSIFIGGLTYDTTEEQLKKVFNDCGMIQYVEIVKNDEGNSKGYGYITFSTLEAAEKAIKIKNETILNGKFIKVQYPQRFEQQEKPTKIESKQKRSKRKSKHRHHRHHRSKYSSSDSSSSDSSPSKDEKSDDDSKKIKYSSSSD